MSNSKKCKKCGGEWQDDAAGGLCPRCLMAVNFASRTMPEDERPNLVVSLSAEEMREHFPQFEILECLGRGGMGVVYKARQKALDRMVAIKVLAGERQGDADFARRFEREAKILAQMSHANIVTVHDFGEADGLYYIVMEYVDGVNLRDLLRDGKMDPEQALAIVPPICEALEYAHDKGVVHRDIKPENLLLDREGRVKIADFGIASLVGAAGERSGTPPYMAPEQERGVVDRRADIYALGAVLYEMLTGERLGTPIEPPSRKILVDVRLDEIVLRALEKEPARRYQTAGEFRTMVETLRMPSASAGEGRDKLKGGQAAVRAEEPPSARFSRTAIIGAALAPFFFLATFLMFVAYGSVMVQPGMPPPGPAHWQILLAFTILPLGLTAPFGTTLLGWIAVTQIRRSAGRLYGLGLAVFDGLLFPLLALNALIGWFWVSFLRELAQAGGPRLSWASWLLLTIITSVAVDLLIVLWTWRAVSRGAADASASGQPTDVAPLAAPPPTSAKRKPSPLHGAALTVAFHTVLLLLFLVFAAYGVPRMLAPLADLGASLPVVTLLAVNGAGMVQRFWWLLFPPFLALDFGICYLLQRFGGRRARNAWSIAVALALVLTTLVWVAALALPLRQITARLERETPWTGEAAAEEKILETISWAKLAAEGRLLGGEPVWVDGRDALRIENTGDTPLQLRLLQIDRPPITGLQYALSGEIRHVWVEGEGYLELWSRFSAQPGQPEAQYFSRTLGPAGSGPMGKIAGTSGWRPFTLPFDRTGTTSPPTRLDFNIFLPARGTVYLGPITLSQRAPTKAVARRKHSIGIYRVTNSPNGYDSPLADLALADEPVIDQDDIFGYDWESHTIRLRSQAAADRVLHGKEPDGRMRGGGSFVVVVDGQRLYRGAMASVASSVIPDAPVIHIGPSAEQWQPAFAIRVYPPARGVDPRGDPRLKQALQEMSLMPGDSSPAVQTDPRVLQTTPSAFDNIVDPSLDRITVTFDRPMMDKSWSFTAGDKAFNDQTGSVFPERIGEIFYDASRTTCAMPVKLQPGTVYWVGINSPQHRNFKSADGTPVPPYQILFATRSAEGTPTPLPDELVRRATQINAGDSILPAIDDSVAVRRQRLMGTWYGQYVDGNYLPEERYCTWEFRDDGQSVYTLGAYGPDGKIDPTTGSSMICGYKLEEDRLVLMIPGEKTRYCPFEIRGDTVYISVDEPNDFVFTRQPRPEEYVQARRSAQNLMEERRERAKGFGEEAQFTTTARSAWRSATAPQY